MEKHKTCSFFGHREIEASNNLKQRICDCVEDLIVNRNVKTFLFGSNSTFDELCHLVVTELKQKYEDIKRVCYTCKSEACTLEIDRKRREEVFSRIMNQEVHLLGFEAEFEHKTKYSAGKASYIERNQAMITDSDFCVFYYDTNYIPPTKTNSGTKLAYNYAIKKQKNIINLFI